MAVYTCDYPYARAVQDLLHSDGWDTDRGQIHRAITDIPGWYDSAPILVRCVSRAAPEQRVDLRIQIQGQTHWVRDDTTILSSKELRDTKQRIVLYSTGLYYHFARVYDPVTERFSCVDRAGAEHILSRSEVPFIAYVSITQVLPHTNIHAWLIYQCSLEVEGHLCTRLIVMLYLLL